MPLRLPISLPILSVACFAWLARFFYLGRDHRKAAPGFARAITWAVVSVAYFTTL
jgi:hypothetical protein